MKKILILMLSLASIVQVAKPMENILAQKFDLGFVLDKVKEFTDQVRLTGNMDQDIKNIIAVAKTALDQVPNKLLDVDQIRQMTPAIELKIKEALPIARGMVNKVNAFMQYPDIAISMLRDVAYPMVIVKLTPEIRDASYKLINFLANNQKAITLVAQKLGAAMNIISAELALLETKDLMALQQSDLARIINSMKNALGDTYPVITNFIETHRGKIEDLIMSLKKMNINASIQDVIKTLESQMPTAKRFAGMA